MCVCDTMGAGPESCLSGDVIVTSPSSVRMAATLANEGEDGVCSCDVTELDRHDDGVVVAEQEVALSKFQGKRLKINLTV